MQNNVKAGVEWVDLNSLAAWDRNARVHSAESTTKLAAGIRRFGFPVPITAWRSERRIAAGHGRRLAMQALLAEDPNFTARNAPEGTPPGSVPVMWVDFASESQFEAFALSDNRQAKNAQDDEALLAAVLADLDAEGIDFDGMGFDDAELGQLLGNLPDVFIEGSDPDPYTAKVESPVYKITGECPEVADLYDNGKTNELVQAIEEAGLDEDATQFLIEAARRHTAFRYDRIAEYYAHAPANVQALMEDSALVIIDFNKAIDLGFVRLTDELSAAYKADHEEEGHEIAYGSILSRDKQSTVEDLLSRAKAKGYSQQKLRAIVNTFNPEGALFDRWYASLAAGAPDYTVYGEQEYLGEALICWNEYSRKYLRALHKQRIVDQLHDVDVVLDLGCGLGLTTAALSEAFPSARVIGTNVSGSLQYDLAASLAADYGFEMHADIPELAAGARVLVFASEYFEHFPAPVERLRDVLSRANPVALVVANTFTGDAIGHFKTYSDGGVAVDRKAIGRLFGQELRSQEYKGTWGGWNNKPRLWMSVTGGGRDEG